MTYALITPPPAEALTLGEVKAHLRLDGADEDVLLGTLISVAREHLERVSGLCLISQTWRLYLDSVPEDGVIQIARGPVQAIESVMLYDAGGEEVSWPVEGHAAAGGLAPRAPMLSRAGLSAMMARFPDG